MKILLILLLFAFACKKDNEPSFAQVKISNETTKNYVVKIGQSYEFELKATSDTVLTQVAPGKYAVIYKLDNDIVKIYPNQEFEAAKTYEYNIE